MLFFVFIFGCISEGLWLHFWCHFDGFLDVFFGTFPDFAKNGAPHGNAVNSSQIEVRHLENQGKNAKKTKEKRQENEGEKITGFGSILAPFWKALGTILGAKMPSKIE